MCEHSNPLNVAANNAKFDSASNEIALSENFRIDFRSISTFENLHRRSPLAAMVFPALLQWRAAKRQEKGAFRKRLLSPWHLAESARLLSRTERKNHISHNKKMNITG